MKKITALLICAILILNLTACSKKEPKQPENNPSQNTDASSSQNDSAGKTGSSSNVIGDLQKDGFCVTLPAGAFDEKTKVKAELAGESIVIEAEGHDFIRLNEPATVQIKLDGPVAPEDLDRYLLYYSDGGIETWIYPDIMKLGEGILEFELGHFSRIDEIRANDDKLAQIYAQNLAKRDISNEAKIDAIMASKDSAVVQFMDDIYDKLGIDNDELKGKLVRATISELNENLGDEVLNFKRTKVGLTMLEMVNAAQDGDITGFSGKVTSLVLDKCVENLSAIKGKYGGAAISALPEAVTLIAEGRGTEASTLILKTVVSEIPYVKYVKLTSELVEMGIENWTDGELEAAYQAYAHGSNGGGGYVVEAGDFESLSEQMRGLYRQIVLNAKQEYCAVNGISMSELDSDKHLAELLEAQAMNKLRSQFDSRRAREGEIDERASVYTDVITSFKNNGLLTREGHSEDLRFDRTEDYTQRLSRLMSIRSHIIDMLGGYDEAKLGEILHANTKEKIDNELAYLTKKWARAAWENGGNGVDGMNAVKKELKDIYGYDPDKAKSGKGGGSAWVLVGTEMEIKELEEDDRYINKYGGSEYSHTKFCEHKESGQATTFEAWYSTAPERVEAGEELIFDIGARVTANTNEEFFFVQNCMIYMWTEPGVSGQTKLRSVVDGKNDCAIGSFEEAKTARVGTVMPNGSLGDKRYVALLSDGVTTWLIYEWKD